MKKGIKSSFSSTVMMNGQFVQNSINTYDDGTSTPSGHVIELNNTTVKDITFVGGNGEVILKGASAVSGVITGGVIRS